MLDLASEKKLHKVVVLNPKGGSGKTTLAFSLAGYLASTGRKVGLLDMDRQGSSTHWLRNRPDSLPKIHALSAPAGGSGTVDVPDDVDCVVIDAPAGLVGAQLIDYTCGAHAILVPVLPSDLDIHAASRLISQLLLKAQVSRRNGRLGIVANRVKERTVAYKQLLRFLDRLSINLVGVLRDSQNYTHAAANGRCIHEMAPSQVRRDTEQWQAITEWLEARLEQPLTGRDWLRPAEAEKQKRRLRPALVFPAAAAAAVGALAIAMWFLAATRQDTVDVSPEPVSPQVAFDSTPVEPIERGVAAESSHQPLVETPTQQPSAADALQERWQLTGVVSANGTDILMLSDREEQTTVHLSGDSDLDGWAVKEAGPNYAVLVQGEDEVRLVLNEDTAL
ncbi:MAG: ParA family protein [Gammaproteobacteria bacterium]|nr:ParA family protein [Gammaproteobacteria bacterium]MDH4004948.1 ParA family protein [Gammaproteobacteria bacterium]